MQFIVLQPRVGSILGGTFIQVIGSNIKFSETTTYTCEFDEKSQMTKVTGIYFIDKRSGVHKILCVSPPLKRIGEINFTISYPDPLNKTQSIKLANDTFLSCKSMYVRT